MKKLLLFITVCSLVFGMSGCKALREELLKAPDEVEIPSGSSVARCVVDEVEYRYVYQNDGVYMFFIDDVDQGEEELHVIQEQAFLHGESVINYLNSEYGVNMCTIEDYSSDK